MKYTKRVVNSFCAVALVVGLMPTTAWADTTDTQVLSPADAVLADAMTAPDFSALESAHNYANKADETVTYTWAEAGTYGMALTFDEQTKTENGYDYITIYRGDGSVVGVYTGTQLAGATVYATNTDTVKIQLTSDSSTTYWGYKVTSVTAMTANDLSLAGDVAPIPATFLQDGVATPDPIVSYGGKTLSEGTDYTVTYSGNTAVGTGTCIITGIGDYTGTLTATFPVVDAEHLADGGAIKADQQKQLRQSGDTGSTSLTINNGDSAWAAAVTAVKVAPVDSDTGEVGEAVTLDASQYFVSASSVSFTRTEADPVFEVEVGSGHPVTISGRWSSTTYPQSAKYQVTIEADGYNTTTAVAQFYTGAADTFSIIVDADGDAKTTDDQTVAKTFTKDEIEAQATFQNGSSQCGMTGFRTFSAVGVSLASLIEQAGVEVTEEDAFKLDTTDDFGATWSYSQLFGDRYFLQSIYTDQDVKDAYAELVKSDDQAGATITLRRLLAEKASEEQSIAKPMISANYKETMITSDEVATAELPTAENTHINALVGQENQYRFTYGISLVQEDCTATFDTGEGSAVASQTVKSHLMTSTENTTMRSTYWNNALIIYKGAAEPDEPSTAADTLTTPANPVRDGYTFAGWYTNPECTGEAYDFTSNDGTIDASTTFYAKWVENLPYEVSTYNQEPIVYSSDNDQHVVVSIDLGKEFVLDEADGGIASGKLQITLAGSDIATDPDYYRPVTASVDGTKLVLDIGNCVDADGNKTFTANYSGSLQVMGTPAVTMSDDSIAPEVAINTVTPIGITTTTEGEGTNSISVTVNHKANRRGMYFFVLYNKSYQLQDDGTCKAVYTPVNTNGTTAGTWKAGTITSHAHMFMTMTPAVLANNIQTDLKNVLPSDYRIEYTSGSDTFNVFGPANSELYFCIFDDNMLQSFGTSLDQVKADQGIIYGESVTPLTVTAEVTPGAKGEKATVTATTVSGNAKSYRFYYSSDEGATWVQVAKNATGVAEITANATNVKRMWKVVATDAAGVPGEAEFAITIKDPTVTTETTPAASYGAQATVTVTSADFGVYGPAKYKYYYSSDEGETWTQIAYHNRTYTATDTLKVTGNSTNAKRSWKVVVTFKDGRTAEAPFTVSYTK